MKNLTDNKDSNFLLTDINLNGSPVLLVLLYSSAQDCFHIEPLSTYLQLPENGFEIVKVSDDADNLHDLGSELINLLNQKHGIKKQ